MLKKFAAVNIENQHRLKMPKKSSKVTISKYKKILGDYDINIKDLDIKEEICEENPNGFENWENENDFKCDESVVDSKDITSNVTMSLNLDSTIGPGEELHLKLPDETIVIKVEKYSSPSMERIKTKKKARRKYNYQSKFASSSRNLNKFERVFKIKKPFKCDQCSKTFSRKVNLKIHKANNHRPVRQFQCDICSNTFTVKSHLKIHIQSHKEEKEEVTPKKSSEKSQKVYPCKFCARPFGNTNNLRFHEMIHTGEKPYKCKMCNESFKRNTELLFHERYHNGEKPFKCEHCSKSFRYKCTLKLHEKRHAGDRFQCKFCLKYFAYESYMKVHERIHSLQCQTCLKSFGNRNELRWHERIHKKKHVCRICKKVFYRSFSLKIHEKTHSKERMYQCQSCSKTYKRKYNFLLHQRTHTA